MSKLYISYVREEIEEAQRLVSEIKSYLPSADVVFLHICNPEILTNSDVVLCLFSTRYKESSDFQQECTLAANLNKTVILLEYKEYGLWERVKRNGILSELKNKLRSENYSWLDKKGKDECLRRLIAYLGLEMPIGNVTGTLVKFDIRSKIGITYTIAGRTGSMQEGRIVDVRLPDGSYKCIFTPTDYPECVIVAQVVFDSGKSSIPTQVIDIDTPAEVFIWKHKQEEQERREKAREEEMRRQKEEAERNNPERQFELGCQFVDDDNYEEAFRCFSRGAALNHAGCQTKLSVLYYYGYGVEKSYSKAFDLARKAADQGYAEGIGLLGNYYKEGIVTQQDITQAIKYLEQAAAFNFVPSILDLGDIYYDKHSSKAVKWYKKAADLGSGKGMWGLGNWYYNGMDGGVDVWTAAGWYRKSAEAGFADGQCQFGYMCELGQGVTKSINDAFVWYKKAADQGYVVAQYNVGNCYLSGWGVSVDKTMAIKYYRAAADQGYVDAQSQLAICLEDSNFKEALNWCKKAVEKGHSVAQNNLGVWFFNGKNDIVKNYSEAFRLFRLSAEQGNAYGQYNLALCYENGYGCSKNIQLAKEWYKKSAEKGHKNSQNALARLKDQ